MSKIININDADLAGVPAGTAPAQGKIFNFAEAFVPQVEEVLRKVAATPAGLASLLAEHSVFNLPLQSHASVLFLAYLFGMRNSMPDIVMNDPKSGWSFGGVASPWQIRLAERKQREEVGAQGSDGRLVVLNFSHPISDAVKTQIAEHFGINADAVEIRNQRFVLDCAGDVVAQVRTYVEGCGIGNFETANFAINPPAMGWGADLLVAALHGRRGSFAPVLSIRERERGTGFELVEVFDLNAAQDAGRLLRDELKAVAEANLQVSRELIEEVVTALERANHSGSIGPLQGLLPKLEALRK